MATTPKLARGASSGRVSVSFGEESLDGLPPADAEPARVQRNLSAASVVSSIGDLDAELATLTTTVPKGGSTPFEAIVHFTNSSATLNLSSPWKVKNPCTSTGTGFAIGHRRLLTNQHVVRDATSLRVSKHGCPGNYEASVLCESAVCDLALVTVEDESFWEGLPHVTFQEAVPELDETVVAVGYPLGATSVTLTRGVVSNVKLMDLSLSNVQESQLTLQIDAAINPGNSGGPVFNQRTNEVVGVAFSGRKNAHGQGFIIPTPVVQRFLAVFEATGTFGRLPCLGAHFQVPTTPQCAC